MNSGNELIFFLCKFIPDVGVLGVVLCFYECK